MLGLKSRWAMLSLLVTACSIGKGISSFAENIKKDEYHGFVPTATLLSKGNYDRLVVYEWIAADHNRIVARHRDAAVTTVTILAIDGSEVCDMPGTDFFVVPPNEAPVGSEIHMTGEVAVLDDADGDGIGSLSFYDDNCVPLGGPIERASLPEAVYGQDRLLIRSGPRLLAVEPRGAGVQVLAENLEQLDHKLTFASAGYVMLRLPTWFIDGGQFVALDGLGKATMRYGSRVTEVVYIDESDYLIDDGGRLLWATPTAATTYAPNICDLREGLTSGFFEYRSPCPDGPLRVTALNGPILQSVAIDTIADHVFAFDLDFDNPAAMFTRPSSDGNPGKEVWFRNKNGESQQLINGVAWVDENSGLGFPTIATGADGALHAQLSAIVDADGGRGRLVRCNPDWNMNVVNGGPVSTDERLLTQAEGVPIPWVGDPYYLQLAHFDGNVGDFIDPFPSGPAIAHGVPADLAAYSTSSDTHMALLGDYDYQTGKGRLGILPANPKSNAGLTLDGGVFASSNTTRTIRWLASDVAMAGFKFYDSMSAVGYIDQWDANRGAGRFVVHDTDLDADYILSDSVREQLPTTWPWLGVVYAVADGERQGIWVQKAH